VNPWELNEPDPTDNGTMGTIPGPVIECNVGDQVIVHFRNKNLRSGSNFKERAHSLHPHGFVFDPRCLDPHQRRRSYLKCNEIEPPTACAAA
jgi:FtsP/CotA-like multicopper oxidase with cupredoxin domain